GTSTSTSHAYATAGTYFVGSQANLSGGSSVNNFDALYVMTVGPPKDLTTRDSLGVIAINRTASAPGAPLIAAGKWIAAVGSVQQAPSYTFSVKTTPSLGTTQWDNYSWAIQALTTSPSDSRRSRIRTRRFCGTTGRSPTRSCLSSRTRSRPRPTARLVRTTRTTRSTFGPAQSLQTEPP